MQLEVRHLQLVAAIVDEGSLTRAGDRLHLTQSALSHQLLDIEARLGTPLFHRINKKMMLTDAGQRVLASARKILDDLTQTEEELRLFATNRKGTIRLTTECYTVYHWLPTVMKTFEAKYPDVEIRIDVDATSAPFEALSAGALDVAFVTSERAPHGIEMETLFGDEMKVIVNPHHRFAAQEYVKPSELAEEMYLTYTELDDNMLYKRMLRPAGLQPKRHMQVRLTEAVIELVKANVGVAVMAQWAVAPYVESGSIAAVPLTKRGYTREWKAAWLASRQMPPFVRSFVDMVAAEAPRATRMSLTLPLPRRHASQ